jgi:uncharacterized protein (DUF2235 family)
MATAGGRRFVVGLDGTWNSTYARGKRRDGHTVLKPSNVLKVCRAVLPFAADGTPQVVYYDIGIGSLAKYPGLSNRLLATLDKYIGGTWGAGFEGNIEDALHFLALNFQPQDEVFVFGFSRGASTARSVARFLAWSGGLPAKEDIYYLPLMFRAYVQSRATRPFSEVLEQINAIRSREPVAAARAPLQSIRPVPIRFLGVWDTVMALGSRFRAVRRHTSIASRSFYIDRVLSGCVVNARHAIAIDEIRYDFRPEIWEGCDSSQRMEQRWFAGVHSNVGGGYVDDGLANLALHWVLAGATNQGLEIDTKFLSRFQGFAQDRLYRSESLLYRILDRLRGRYGRGRRVLTGWPASANLSLDKSVIHRIQADPKNFKDMSSMYRPSNVLQCLKQQSNLEDFLATIGLPESQRVLPQDVMTVLTRD